MILNKQKFAHVWPLIDGLPGVNALQEPTVLTALARGFMPIEEACKQEAEGNLVLMSGKRPEELYALKRKPGNYQTAELEPEAEEPPEEKKEPVPSRPRGRPRKSRVPYKRRDIVAEKP